MPDPALAIAVPLIAGFEGFCSEPYKDIGGTWTIGYGFTYLPDGSRVTASTPPMTEAQAMAVLTTLVARTMAVVADMIDVPISSNALAACTSFSYNEGTGRFRSSAILQHINTRDMLNAARYFGGYCYCNGKQIPDLVKRRGAEAELFSTPDGVVAESAPSQMTADQLDNLYNPGA